MSNKKCVEVLAPMTGTIVSLAEVPDRIFEEKVFGDGLAIIPKEGKIVSPVDGVVTKILETGHFYGVTTEDGVEVLVHVGLETVALNGKCFEIYVKEGDKVKAGDLIAEADLAFIKETGRNPITPVIIGLGLKGKELSCGNGEAEAGKTVIMTLTEK